MIAVDSSALIAILEREPEAETFLLAIRDAPRRLASAVTVYETGIVIGMRRGRDGAAEIMPLLDELGIEIVAFAEPYIPKRSQPIPVSAKASIRTRASSWVTAPPTRSRKALECRSCSKAQILHTRMFCNTREKAFSAAAASTPGRSA